MQKITIKMQNPAGLYHGLPSKRNLYDLVC